MTNTMEITTTSSIICICDNNNDQESTETNESVPQLCAKCDHLIALQNAMECKPCDQYIVKVTNYNFSVSQECLAFSLEYTNRTRR